MYGVKKLLDHRIRDAENRIYLSDQIRCREIDILCLFNAYTLKLIAKR